MKNIFKIFLLSALVFTVGCENEDDPRFQDNPEFGWVEFQGASTTVAVTPRTTTISVPINYTAPVNLSDLTVTYSITDVVGSPVGVVTSLGSSLTIVGNTNRASIQFDPLSNAVAALIANGDVEFDITITAASRGVAVGLADGSSTTTHRVNLLCGGEPASGTYTIDMHDSFGDGWQTNDGNGGDGMRVTLTDLSGDETVLEIGMCSPYGAAAGTFLGDGDCTGPASTSFFDATTTITLPATTTGAVWNWPGDRYGEISFEIYNPDGSLLYAAGINEPEGELPVSYCQ